MCNFFHFKKGGKWLIGNINFTKVYVFNLKFYAKMEVNLHLWYQVLFAFKFKVSDIQGSN